MLPLQLIPGADTVNVADSAKVALQSVVTEVVNNPSEVLTDLTEKAIQFGLKIVAALVIYSIGAWLIKRVKKILQKIFEKKNTETTLATFVTSLVSISLTIILIILTISALGVNTTSLAALLAAGGMAIGMAMSGTVQNFAGGIMLLAFKPFKAGDFISAQGYMGTVEEVSIVSTKLLTVDNRVIILPNGALSNGNIDNFSTKALRRVDFKFGFEYGIDADKCIAELQNILAADSRILDAKTAGAADPFVVLSELADSSVNFTVRVWVKAADYWGVFFDTNKAVYTTMPEKGFGFPFPQMDVHMKQN
ncbi:MAG: mechanosensitive ion channel [Bacteroidales bacterium]|nr:mechanosensitive ion channel [Bacteroidales bacterium]